MKGSLRDETQYKKKKPQALGDSIHKIILQSKKNTAASLANAWIVNSSSLNIWAPGCWTKVNTHTHSWSSQKDPKVL